MHSFQAAVLSHNYSRTTKATKGEACVLFSNGPKKEGSMEYFRLITWQLSPAFKIKEVCTTIIENQAKIFQGKSVILPLSHITVPATSLQAATGVLTKPLQVERATEELVWDRKEP